MKPSKSKAFGQGVDESCQCSLHLFMNCIDYASSAMTDLLTKFAYQALQQGKSVFSVTHKAVNTRLLNLVAPLTAPANNTTTPISPATLLEIQQRLSQLQDEDWADAERGIYPSDLLFDEPWQDFLKFYPALWLDMPGTWQRIQDNQYQEFSPDIETEGYPQYYLRNFHYQTDGYLSDQSANLYDLQVELLFNGAANAMRRRVLAPLKQGLGPVALPERELKLLDVACGTGNTLKLLRGTFPQASLYGVDLSAAYLRKANERLCQRPGELPQLAQANGEALPYQDGYFHGITCVFLFHELPGPVRQTVINESFRVLKPGGTYVICDSIQAEENPELKSIMENFSIAFHEPFYRNYIEDDLEARLTQAGFEDIHVSQHFMSKYWSARKPA